MTPLHFPYLCVWSRLFNSLYTFSGVRPFLATCSMNLQGRRQHLWSTLVPKSWWQVLCRSLQASLAAALQNSAPLTISWRFLKFVFFLLRTCLDKNYTQFITIPWFFSPRLAENHESKCRSEAVHRGWACSGSFGKRFGRPKRSKNRQMPQVQNSKYWHYIYYICVCVMMIRCDSIHAHTHIIIYINYR